MKKGKPNNTLLNYFASREGNASVSKSDHKTNGGHNGKAGASEGQSSGGATSSQTSDTGADSAFKLYDLVWAKLDGYPWWPSIVCPHPKLNTHVKRKGKQVSIHVQFFDDPVSRAWIGVRSMKEYFGKTKSDVPLLKDLKWNQAIEFADQAMKMAVDDRYTLIAELRATDDEDEELSDIDVDVSTPKDVSMSSPNKGSSVGKETPKSKAMKCEPKSDLKRKASHRESDRKKFKRIALELSDDESKGSDEDFKVTSEEESTDDEDVQQVSSEEESDELSLDDESEVSDLEPKHKRSKSSKSKSKSKSK
ncbi:unnamed protein product, partial [Oppiella nova]